jgi:hypothetical protein
MGTFPAVPFLPLILTFFGQIAPGWKVVMPLLVTLEQDEDGSYVVADDQFLVYGHGDTREQAISDYVVSLIDYYQLLSLRAESNQHSQALFGWLRQYLRPSTQ